MRAQCQHCTTNLACRPRGLCYACYYTPRIRRQYASLSKYASRGLYPEGAKLRRLNYGPPTSARPGTPEKVLVLACRASRGHYLWHPADATLDSPTNRLEPCLC